MLMRGASRILTERTKTKEQKQEERLTQVLRQRPQSPFDIKKELWCPTQFIKFLESSKGIKSHFENCLTREILFDFMFPKRFHNEVLSRKEISQLMVDLSEKFKKEDDLRKRVHLALIVCSDVSFKLKGVYKEQGQLLKLIIGQVAQDFERFRTMVGKNVYRTMKTQQIELSKVQERRQKQALACEGRIKLLLEQQEVQKKQNLLKDQESTAIKRLLYELQKKNEQYLRKIQDLESKIYNGTASVRARNKFRKIIHKIIPERMSIMRASRKIMENKLVRPRESIGKAAEQTFNSFKADADEKIIQSARSSKNSIFSNKNVDIKICTRLNSERGSCFSFISHPTINEPGPLDLLIPKDTIRGSPRINMPSKMKNVDQSSQSQRFSVWSKPQRERPDSMMPRELPKHIYTYLVSDIEKVSRFYVIPDGTMCNQATQAETPTRSLGCQTDISLIKPIYDDIFRDKSTLREFVKDFNFRQNLKIDSLLNRVMDLIAIRRKKVQDEQSEVYSNRNITLDRSKDNDRPRNSTMKGRGLDFYMKLNRMCHLARPSMLIKKLKSGDQSPVTTRRLNQSTVVFNESYSMKKNFDNYHHFFKDQKPGSSKMSQSMIPSNSKLGTQLNVKLKTLTLHVDSTESNLGEEPQGKVKEGAENMMGYLKTVCKQVLQDHLRDELSNDNKFGMSKDRKLILVSKFLFTEEFRVKDLQKQILNMKITNQTLKEMLNIEIDFKSQKPTSMAVLPSYIQKRGKRFLCEEKNLLQAVSTIDMDARRYLSPMTLDSPCTSVVVSSMKRRNSLPDILKLREIKITSPLIRSIMVSPLQLRMERNDVCFDLVNPLIPLTDNVTKIFNTVKTNQNNSITSLPNMQTQMSTDLNYYFNS